MPNNPLTQAELTAYTSNTLYPQIPAGYFFASPPTGAGPLAYRLFDASYISIGIINPNRLGTGSTGAGNLYLADNGTWKSITVATPTLAQVTTAGNTTTNSITVGGLIANGTILSTSTTTGQSLISSGLVVNNAAGGTANDNFIVKSLLLPSLLYVDAVNNKIGINTSTPSQLLDVNGVSQANQFKLSALNTAPATATTTGTLGEIRIDASYIYICTATNSWKRVAIATW
jgi:hypothetical protein